MTESSNESDPRWRGGLSTSRSLLARARRREPAAWRRLVELYAPLVRHWCRRARLREDEINDVLQEAFHAAAHRLDTFEKTQPGDTFRGWLRTITRRKICDHHRRQMKTPRALGGTEAQVRIALVSATQVTEEDSDNRSAERLLLRRALDLVRPAVADHTWRAFWLSVVESRSTAEVAAELSMTPVAVRVARSRVLHRLRRELGDLD